MIAVKILNVMTKIGPMIKDKTNEEKGFDYVSLASIIIKAREAMIEEKMIMIPYEVKQVVQKGNDVIINMCYRFFDTEVGTDGKNEYIDVNVVGEGCDKEGWAVYKALSGAYKYAMTQTFAIPTIDDAEKSKADNIGETQVQSDESQTTESGELDEGKIESILGNPSVEDFDNIFSLDKKIG